MPQVLYDSNAGDAVKKESKPVNHTSSDQSAEVMALNSTFESAENTGGMLSSFLIRPKGIHVAIQKSDEVILLLMRRHIITNIGWILTGLLMIIGPMALSFFPLLNSLPGNFQLMALLLWYLLTTGFILEQFLSWYFHVFIVTDRRIIDIDFLNLIYKNIASAKLYQIQDVTVVISGAIPSLFNYGNVLMQTAAATTQLEFEHIPNPKSVAKLLNELIAVSNKKQRI